MKMQRLLSLVRKAVDDYHMIKRDDTIAVGISGGKDSLTLLRAMTELQRFYPVPFQIKAIAVDLGFPGTDYSSIASYCESSGAELQIVHTEIAKIVFEIREEGNPCSLCAKLRKGALNNAAKELGCNKVAYAHHKDDVIETMMMSLIYEGRFHTFEPVTELDHSGLTMIRPMIYVNECDVIGFIHKNPVPVLKNPCPADGNTRREEIKNLIKEINKNAPGVRERLFHAIQSGIDPEWNIESLKN